LSLAILVALSLPASAQGPTARKLKSLGSDVAIPGDPPLGKDAAGEVKGKPVGPIDGGKDLPPYEIEIMPQALVGAQKAPLPTARAGGNEPQKPDQTDSGSATPSRIRKGLALETSAPEPVEVAGSPDACFAELLKIAEANTAPPPDSSDDACVIEKPVILKSTKGKDPVEFPPSLLLDCSFARHVAEFTADVVQPLALFHMGKSIKQVQSGQGFECRRRNNALTGKLSEHAFGNATDWVGFKFDDGQQLSIKAEELVKSPQAEFLNAVRAAGCGYFTTVLGPGSNAAHATHFHFDRGRTKGKKNPYRICE